MAVNQKQMNKTMEMKGVAAPQSPQMENSSKMMGQSDDLEISVSQTKTVNVGKFGSTQQSQTKTINKEVNDLFLQG